TKAIVRPPPPERASAPTSAAAAGGAEDAGALVGGVMAGEATGEVAAPFPVPNSNLCVTNEPGMRLTSQVASPELERATRWWSPGCRRRSNDFADAGYLLTIFVPRASRSSTIGTSDAGHSAR